MTDRPIDELLREADAAAPTRPLEPPRVADLERMHRRQVAVRTGGALVLLLLLVTGLAWRTADDAQPADESLRDAQARIAASLDDLQNTLASLRQRPAAPSAASESAALDTFEALRPGARRGDAQSIEGLRWLADRFPRTHGGQCARLLLESSDSQPDGTTR